MFVRSKTIKGKQYGYLVQNVWRKNKVSQKVKKYLGPIIHLDSNYIRDPLDVENYDWTKPVKLLFREIICDMFVRLGFEQKNWRLIKDDLIINLATCKINSVEKDVVLALNGRYLYGKGLNTLQNFVKEEDEEDERGAKLAQLFSDFGIFIAPGVFIQLYRRIYL